mmetsp:Transcript_101456/g.322391  ORF Transcript_101456/g.322391 Transcript_101456/m.322391 type:complete len:290 (-) Transcript_101456:55-924(-)
MEQRTASEAPAPDDSNAEDEWPSGEREWSFRDGRLVVKAYEDFVAAAIGGVVTAASGELARFAAEAVPEGHWVGRRCVELGAGCGLVSSTLMQLGARVIATDLEPFIDHLQSNIRLNVPPEEHAGSCSCRTFDWGDADMRRQLRDELGESGAEAVFAANCIYDHEVIPLFIEAIAATAGSSTLVFMCGVPQPPANPSGEDLDRATVPSLLDDFLEAAPLRFDCHFLLPAREGAVSTAAPTSPVGGLAARLAAQHGLPVAALADGIWLLMPRGAAPPEWARPVLRLGSPA